MSQGIAPVRLRLAAVRDLDPASIHTIQFEFDARCLGYADAGKTGECTSTTEALAAAALEDVFTDFTGLGYRLPFLQHDVAWGGLYNPTPLTVTYIMQIRPYYDESDEDWDGVCKVDADGSGNQGKYNRGSTTAVVCFGSPNHAPNTFDAGRISTLRHEYFHASQYPFVETATSWFKESTAVASQASLTTMVRDTGRSVRAVDVSINQGRQKYSLQDLWMYLGQRFGIGMPEVIPFLQAGGDTAGVDFVLSSDPTYASLGGFGPAYWAWAKNQAFEKEHVPGGSGFAVTCGLDVNASGRVFALEGGRLLGELPLGLGIE